MADLDRLSIAQCEGTADRPHQTIIYVDKSAGCPLCIVLRLIGDHGARHACKQWFQEFVYYQHRRGRERP
jgi:hypothetical protein